MLKWPNHGGQAEQMKTLFQLPTEKKVIDFSANLNPLGPPAWLKREFERMYEHVSTYPDPNYTLTKEAIAKHEQLNADHVLVTNGGAEAIFLVAKYFMGKRAGIVQPTFVEYEQACLHYALDVEDIFLQIDDAFSFPIAEVLNSMHNVDVIFLGRPNNPTGTLVAEADIRILLEEGRRTKTTIVVDEAFVNFLPENEASLTPLLGEYSNLILLRSLTKLFTIPGLRIGYMLASVEVIKTLSDVQLPWSVNSIVSRLVPKLLEDEHFVQQTREWLRSQLAYLRKALKELNFYYTPTQVNFYLLQDKQNRKRSQQLFEFLLEHGLLARHTYNFKSLDGQYLRLAVRSAEENAALIYTLQEWREKH